MLRFTRRPFVSSMAAIIAISVFVTLWIAMTSDSTQTRVVWAQRIGAAVWWLVAVLSVFVPAGLLAVLVVRVPTAGRRDVSTGVTSDSDRKFTGNRKQMPKQMRPVRRLMLRVWFGAIVLWMVLELIGAAWMLSEQMNGQRVVDTTIRRSLVDHGPLPTLPATLRSKPDDEVLLLMMGGSTAGGDPYAPVHNNLYAPGFSFIEAVALRLQELFPELRAQSVKFAFGGGTLQDAYGLLGRLQVRPDVIVVYSGHNEIFTRFPPEREAWEEPTSRTPTDTARRLLPPSLIARCIEARLETFSVAAIPPDQNQRRLFDRPLCTPTEAEHIYQRFHETLEAIVRFCHQHNIRPLLIIPAANESGFDPSRSWLPIDFPDDKRRKLEAIYRQLDHGKPNDKTRVALLESAFELAPRFAETCFRLGHEYERRGRFSDAQRCYQTAIDFDGYPLRASSRIAEIYHKVAGDFDACLIDAREVLRPFGANAILGDDLIHDNCHPNVVGYTALANATLDALHELEVPNRPWPSSFEQLTPQHLVRYFSIDREKWAEVFDFVGRDFSESLSLLRYDPAERLKKGDAYRAAAADIAEETWPQNNGIPDTRVLSPP